MIRQPVRAQADIHDPDISSERPLETAAGDDILHRRAPAIHCHIEIQDLLPHRREKNAVTLLAGIFLRDLQLNGCIRLLQSAKQGRRWFPHLEVNGTVLDLNNDVIVELAVQGMEDIVGSTRAVGLEIIPVKMMVVDECTVEEDSAMRF
jgi:hypothetical protein